MADHFADDARGRRARRAADKYESSRRARRPQNPYGPTDDTSHHMPYGEVASYRGPYRDAVYDDSYYLDEVPARGGIRRLGRGLALVLAWAARLCALVAFALLALNVMALSPLEGLVARIDDVLETYLPWLMAGPPGVDTPFGGTFRVELALVSLVMFVADWLLCRLRALIR